jgi:hypothetical protein
MTLFSAYTVDFVIAFCRVSQTEFCNKGVSVAVQIYELRMRFLNSLSSPDTCHHLPLRG